MKPSITRAACRVILFILFLEGFMRLGGWLFTASQQWRNTLKLHTNQVRVLSLGDSFTTTGGPDAYPIQLERLLNQQSSTRKFSVFVEGQPSTSILYFVTNLETYIEKYQPDVITLMIGILDRFDDQVLPKPLNNTQTRKAPWRTWKLVHSLVHDAFKHLRDTHFPPPPQEKTNFDSYLLDLERRLTQNPSADGYYDLAKAYSATNQKEAALKFLQKTLAIDPRHYRAWGRLGRRLTRLKDYAQAVDAYTKALTHCPADQEEYHLALLEKLGDLQAILKNYPKALRHYQQATTLFEHHPRAYGKIGKILMEAQAYDKAEAFLIRQLKINPQASEHYGHLAQCFSHHHRGADAEKLLRRAIARFPDDALLHYELAQQLLRNQKWLQAQDIFKQTLSQFPSKYRVDFTEDIYQKLMRLSKALNNPEEFRRLKEELSQLQSARLNDYQIIQDILARHDIPLIVIQYPLWEVAPLKELYSSSSKITFIENKKDFEVAIAREGLEAYFVDMHVGPFGHCTAKGNHIIANNVARAILELP